MPDFPPLMLTAFTGPGLTLLQASHPLTDPVVLVLLVISVLVAGVLAFTMYRLRVALRKLREGAHRFARGDLSQRIDARGLSNMAGVADSLNEMAELLEERLQTVVDQRNEFSAVLSNMSEGVLTVDLQDRITSMNPAAARLLGVEAAACFGRTVQETIRNSSLQRLIERLVREGGRIDGAIELRSHDASEGTKAKQIQVNGSVLRRSDGQATGSLLVLHDVTKLHHLESVRRDFVANVSHELKTPVAAIKAAAETLQHLEEGDEEAAVKFQAMIVRHADRLQAIIEDLLMLAKLEQQTDGRRFDMESRPLAPIIRSACEICQVKADAKQMSVQIACEPDLVGHVHAPMLEQAVVNLLDNAIKYSPEGGDVIVSAGRRNGELVIAVEDHGPGIDLRDQHRLFERFYRADKARSRHQGGTGLGLSIVKHITEAHGGRVILKSKQGQGSTFYLHLPIDAARPESMPSTSAAV